ncbi:MAG: hypothetical protein WD232_07415 [Acidimicrobiales bacterium]
MGMTTAAAGLPVCAAGHPRAVDGPLRGTTLESYPHVDTFWFARAAFLPDTDVVPELEGS